MCAYDFNLLGWLHVVWTNMFFYSKFRFIVRDFQYNEEEMKADKEEMNRLSTDKKKQFVSDVLQSCLRSAEMK